ncbi:hypothetical protein NQ315_000536, partial [Exocentrus adspersus]
IFIFVMDSAMEMRKRQFVNTEDAIQIEDFQVLKCLVEHIRIFVISDWVVTLTITGIVKIITIKIVFFVLLTTTRGSALAEQLISCKYPSRKY